MLRIEKIFPGEQLTIDPRESAFSHGMGIFESMQISNGYLQFWDRHWARLKASASHLFSYELSQVNQSATLEAIQMYYQAIGKRDLILKLSFMVLENEPVLYIYSRKRISDDGPAKLSLNRTYPINENSVYTGYKTHNYLENIWLLNEAKLAGYSDYLRVNTKGEVCETCVGNCFFIKDDEIITASSQTGLFPGVIRAVLFEALPIEEKQIRVDDLETMDGCFVTNSIVEILPVSEIAGLPKQTVHSFSESSFSKIELIASTLKTIAQSEAINLH